MDAKVDGIKVEMKMADIPQTDDHSTPKSTSRISTKKVQISRVTNNTLPELPASVALLDDVPAALHVPDYTSVTTNMDENMYDSDSTITDPDMADYLLANMQNPDNPAMQNTVLNSGVRGAVSSIIQSTVDHTRKSTIYPTIQNTGVSIAMQNMANFDIQNGINHTSNLAIQNTIRLILQNTVNSRSTMQDATNPSTAFGTLMEPPEPYESTLPHATICDNDTTMSETAEEADQLRSSPCSTEIENRIRVHNPMSISWIVHPIDTEPNQSLSAIIDPAPVLSNATDSSILDSRARSRPADLPIVQSLIQAYILKAFHILLPLEYITTEDLPGAYSWNARPFKTFTFFRERSSSTWSPEELSLFTRALGKSLCALWDPWVELPESVSMNELCNNFLMPRYELEMSRASLKEKKSFSRWYFMHTGEEWCASIRPHVQVLQRIPGLQLPAATELTKAHKYVQLKEMTMALDDASEEMWADSWDRLTLKRKLDLYLTGLEGVDITALRAQYTVEERLAEREAQRSREEN
ncbi:hypothetical protein DFP73DRAFT_533344 [Morchella snyderi]|nr:hypothetical protein DFP73DRAFT_533344 [Morchella snyderi]